jgi:hypothetical protein
MINANTRNFFTATSYRSKLANGDRAFSFPDLDGLHALPVPAASCAGKNLPQLATAATTADRMWRRICIERWALPPARLPAPSLQRGAMSLRLGESVRRFSSDV